MQEQTPPPWVVEHFNLPGQNWLPTPPGYGRIARTWVSTEWVLQSRPISLLDRMLALHQLSKEIYLPGLSFAGPLMIEDRESLTVAKPGASRGCLWDLQPRLRELRPLYDHQLTPDQLINNSMLAFPEIAAELQHFAGAATPNRIDSLPSTPGVRIQQASYKRILILADQACPLAKNPVRRLGTVAPTSPRVLSHGDPTLKNTLLTPSGPCLIDWEAISVLPRHMDLTHMAAYLCKHTLPERWDEIIWRHWERARNLLPSWSGRHWHMACCWYLAREIIAFPIKDQEKLELYWKGLNQQISRVVWKYD